MPRQTSSLPPGLPPDELALAKRRASDVRRRSSAPLDAAYVAELNSQLDALDEALTRSGGVLVEGAGVTLADCFVFSVVECARACGAAPAGSVISAPRPAVAAWRLKLLQRPAFRDAAAAIAASWALPDT